MYYLGFIFNLFLICSFVNVAIAGSENEKYDGIAKITKVLHYIEKNYVNDVTTDELVNGAIKGMLTSLDTHSDLLSPEVYEQVKKDTSGKYGGVGIELWLAKDGLLTVTKTLKNSPAAKIGIRTGDKIIKINDNKTTGLSMEDVFTKMRGKVGDKISLSVFRKGSDQLQKFTMKRSVIKLEPVEINKIANNYIHIRLNHFQDQAGYTLEKKLKEQHKDIKIKGIVLDLRNNPGGLLDEAVKIANLFIDSGVIVSTRGKAKQKISVRKAKSGTADTSTPIVVLVNGNTASAAEIVAGAIKDHQRGLIVGTKTFGKGSVQQVIPLSEDSAIKLTVAKYYTPQGISIQDTGINPDVEVPEINHELFSKAIKKPDYLREIDYSRKLSSIKNGKRRVKDFEISKSADTSKTQPSVDLNNDYQLQQAILFLKGFQFLSKVERSQKL